MLCLARALPAHAILVSLALLLAGCVARLSPTPHAAAALATLEQRAPITLLVSIDGFRSDYLTRGITPNLSMLATRGVTAPMRPSFPSKTFPNHYTLVTGLRPDRHGIVDNSMEDPGQPGVTFSLGNATQALDPFWWNAAEPIWITAERAGIVTATMFWPGSEVAIGGMRPRTWQRFDQNITGGQRVEAVLDWMRRPAASRPRFVTLYFDTVDTAGHQFGPDAVQTNAAIAALDAQIGDLLAGLTTLGQQANIVITSDHGMAATSQQRVVPLATLVDPAAVRIVSDGPYLAAEPVEGQDARVAAALVRRHTHVECWRKGSMPARFHYGRHRRVPAFFCLAENGWTITRPDREPYFGGAHGYDPAHPDMAGIFIAAGPAVRSGVRLEPFDNVHVYPLLARLIGVAPRPSDGAPAVAEAVLH